MIRSDDPILVLSTPILLQHAGGAYVPSPVDQRAKFKTSVFYCLFSKPLRRNVSGDICINIIKICIYNFSFRARWQVSSKILDASYPSECRMVHWKVTECLQTNSLQKTVICQAGAGSYLSIGINACCLQVRAFLSNMVDQNK